MVLAYAALALVLAQQPQTDTTFAVRPGGRLEIDAHGASANVRTWDRDAIRIQASHTTTIRVRIRERAGTVAIEADRRNGGPATGVRYDVTVPRRFDIAMDGVNVVADVDGVQGTVKVENVEGAIMIRNVTGNIDVESVSGSILVDNVRGDVRASSVNQRVLLTAIRGNIDVETVQGSIVMRGIDAGSVEASTVNGVIEYDGVIRDSGRYSLSTHNGRVIMSVPEQANATFDISTFNGTIDAAFPVAVRNMRNRTVAFTLGSGSARVEIESFNGSIQLTRPRGR
jgi:hypothetical protein